MTNKLIYNGSHVGRTYAHHPHLHASADGRTVYLIHSTAAVDEDQMGEETWTSISHDGGRSWSTSRQLLPAALLPNQTSPGNFSYWCGQRAWQRALGALQIVQVGQAIYGVAQTADYICFDGANSTRKGAGRIARRIDKHGAPAGDPCWVSKTNWTDAAQYPRTVYGRRYGMRMCAQARQIGAVLASPAQVPAWSSWIYNNKLYAADGAHDMQENTHALWIEDRGAGRRGGGYWQRFWRDISSKNVSGRVWVEYTHDRLGGDWYPKTLEQYGNRIYETTIPDDRTKQYLGQLDDGDRYLVHNPRNNASCTSGCERQPLVVSMSRGGDLSYKWAGVVRTNASTNAVPGKSKNHGFSYPTAVQVGDKLIVAYSENKENIWVSLIDVKDLPGGGRHHYW